MIRRLLTLAVLLVSSPSFGQIYIQGMFSYQKLSLSNSVTSYGDLDLTSAYMYSGEAGMRTETLRIGLRYDHLNYGVTVGAASNDLSQQILWGIVGLPLGKDRGLFRFEAVGGVGYLFKNQIVLANVQAEGVDVDGTYENTGLAFLGGLRTAIGTMTYAFILEGGYRFVMPIQFLSDRAVLGGDTSGLYLSGGLRLSF